MLTRLALRNVKRQLGNYLVYFATVSITIALLFSINSMTYCKQIREISSNNENFSAGLVGVTVFVAIATSFVLSYATSFMLKLRRKEFGMYLTLGMTKKNIICLFLAETLFLFLAALATGTVTGFFLYQGLMALLSVLIDVEITIAAYSFAGTLQTVLFGFLMFFLSALGSIRYLMKTHISELLKNNPQEKTEKHLFVFAFLSLLSFLSICYLIRCLFSSLDTMFQSNDSGASIILMIPALAVSFLLFHTFLSRSLMGVLLRLSLRKPKSTRIFTLRQLSGRMRINSLMLGVLSVLFFFAFLLSNLSFAAQSSNRASVRLECPFDVLGRIQVNSEIPVSPEQAEEIIEKYNDITEKAYYSAYTTNEGTLRDYVPEYRGEKFPDTFVPLSQFNQILKLNGYKELTLTDSYVVVSRYHVAKPEHFKDAVFTRNGVDYTFAGLKETYPFYVYGFMYMIVPDEAISGMTREKDYYAYQLESNKFDMLSMYNELKYPFYDTDSESTHYACDYDIRSLYEKWTNDQIGISIIAMLYVSVIFLCMALAVLSLKTLSGLKEDKLRYLALRRLGVDRSLQKRTLLGQTFLFFLFPFALPVLMTVVFAAFTCKLYRFQGFPELIPEAILSAILITLLMSLIYGLYFIITYRISKRNVLADDVSDAGERKE